MEDYALVIGLNHYEDRSLSNLNGAIKDAEEMRKWFIDPDKGGIDENNCEIVISSENPINPRKHIIDDALESIYLKAQTNGGGRRLYFYFSGHGFSHKMEDNTLVISDWLNPIRFNNALNSKKYMEVIQESGVFKEILFFLDCCRTRKIKCQGQGPQLGFARPDDNQPPAQNVIAFAAEYNNPAYEAQHNIDNNGIVRSYFTKALLEGLGGAEDAKNDQGEVTLNRLSKYTTKRTMDIARAFNHSQKPKFLNHFDDDPVLVTYPVNETDQLITLTIISELSNFNFKIENSLLEEVSQHTYNDTPLTISLPKDIYSITNLTTNDIVNIDNTTGKTEYHVTI